MPLPQLGRVMVTPGAAVNAALGVPAADNGARDRDVRDDHDQRSGDRDHNRRRNDDGRDPGRQPRRAARPADYRNSRRGAAAFRVRRNGARSRRRRWKSSAVTDSGGDGAGRWRSDQPVVSGFSLALAGPRVVSGFSRTVCSVRLQPDRDLSAMAVHQIRGVMSIKNERRQFRLHGLRLLVITALLLLLPGQQHRATDHRPVRLRWRSDVAAVQRRQSGYVSARDVRMLEPLATRARSRCRSLQMECCASAVSPSTATLRSDSPAMPRTHPSRSSCPETCSSETQWDAAPTSRCRPMTDRTRRTGSRASAALAATGASGEVMDRRSAVNGFNIGRRRPRSGRRGAWHTHVRPCGCRVFRAARTGTTHRRLRGRWRRGLRHLNELRGWRRRRRGRRSSDCGERHLHHSGLRRAFPGRLGRRVRATLRAPTAEGAEPAAQFVSWPAAS